MHVLPFKRTEEPGPREVLICYYYVVIIIWKKEVVKSLLKRRYINISKAFWHAFFSVLGRKTPAQNMALGDVIGDQSTFSLSVRHKVTMTES